MIQQLQKQAHRWHYVQNQGQLGTGASRNQFAGIGEKQCSGKHFKSVKVRISPPELEISGSVWTLK
jgi:hypothetical protein